MSCLCLETITNGLDLKFGYNSPSPKRLGATFEDKTR